MLQKTLAFIDIETTGTDVVKHEILEIGLVVAKMNDQGHYVLFKEHEWKVKPERIEDADPVALRVNGYDPGKWLFAHSLTQAMQALAKETEGAVMVAHNVGFDYSFIAKAFADTGVENKMFYANLDTISLAVAKLHRHPQVKRYTLRALCEFFNITNERAHTALADARATFELYQRLMQPPTQR
ncbi:MAG: 3'-5' exonuclease [Candidatus Pacebacteria bacterium]|nr:3'-5' exonuclease [Candidatus Paceibacterota bacterium]MCD8507866.1 3'-5' exonuclease [Candidatus Paceibacterota bacterium]MCD8527940.1 3'-5' exonuclease [Candidatus Paceibacterota bacterium]MCD8563945.1 3'-5' exonuclease [Candidatus Paceibacterota bacterium]